MARTTNQIKKTNQINPPTGKVFTHQSSSQLSTVEGFSLNEK